MVMSLSIACVRRGEGMSVESIVEAESRAAAARAASSPTSTGNSIVKSFRSTTVGDLRCGPLFLLSSVDRRRFDRGVARQAVERRPAIAGIGDFQVDRLGRIVGAFAAGWRLVEKFSVVHGALRDRADHGAAIGAAPRRERRRIKFFLASVTVSHGGSKTSVAPARLSLRRTLAREAWVAGLVLIVVEVCGGSQPGTGANLGQTTGPAPPTGPPEPPPGVFVAPGQGRVDPA